MRGRARKAAIWTCGRSISASITASTDRLVIGLLGQMDWTDEDETSGGTGFEGVGWLAGPYIAARLHEHLIVDGRLAYGASRNDVNPIGDYKDEFDTHRWLVRGQLTGDFPFRALTLNPFIKIVYFRETQESYRDTPGNTIPSQTMALGHLNFGPEIKADLNLDGGYRVSPHLSVSGVWEFERPDEDAGEDAWRARLGGGLDVGMPRGWTFSLEGFYDGLGQEHADAWGASLILAIPLGGPTSPD